MKRIFEIHGSIVDGTGVPVSVNDNEKYNEKQIETGAYYDMLFNFCNSVIKANTLAAKDGVPPKQLATKLVKLSDDFKELCMEQVAVKSIPRAKPGNFMRVSDGWGFCPICGCKIIKVSDKTVLKSFPAFCKRCKIERVVNWWKE